MVGRFGQRVAQVPSPAGSGVALDPDLDPRRGAVTDIRRLMKFDAARHDPQWSGEHAGDRVIGALRERRRSQHGSNRRQAPIVIGLGVPGIAGSKFGLPKAPIGLVGPGLNWARCWVSVGSWTPRARVKRNLLTPVARHTRAEFRLGASIRIELNSATVRPARFAGMPL
jgi:hypothetical protein